MVDRSLEFSRASFSQKVQVMSLKGGFVVSNPYLIVKIKCYNDKKEPDCS